MLCDLPHLDCVVGIPKERQNPEDLQKIRDEINFQWRLGSTPDAYEISANRREEEIIEFAADSAWSFLKERGRKRLLQAQQGFFHLYDLDFKISSSEGRQGDACPVTRKVSVKRQDSEAYFAVVCFHEFVHAISFCALQVAAFNENGCKLLPYRSGLSFVSRDGALVYLNQAEEAIVSSLEIEFYNKCIEVKNSAGITNTKISFSYEDWREDLWKVVDRIFRRTDRQRFKARSQVLDVFIDAQINGHLTSLAKLFEETLGRHSFADFATATAKTIEYKM